MVFTSIYPDTYEAPTQDLPSYLMKQAETHSVFGQSPNHLAFSDSQTSLSYADVKRMAERFASGLANNLGLGKGDVLAIILPNTAYYAPVVIGAHMAGLVCATANPAYTKDEMTHLMRLCRPKCVVTTAASLSLTEVAVRLSGAEVSRERVLTVDGSPGSNFADIFSDQPYTKSQITTAKEARETAAFIVLSSGTTGLPKGVVLSHANIIANLVQNAVVEDNDSRLDAVSRSTPYQSHVACLPYFHVYGLLLVLLFGVARGRHQIVMPKFDLELFCQLAAKHKAAAAHLVPPIIIQLAKSPIVSKYDLSNLVHINSGAAPLSKETQAAVQSRLGCYVTQAYGLSEASPVTHRATTEGAPVGSVGYLLPYMQCKIINEYGEELGVNDVGEICLRGPNVMLGYLQDQEATAQAIDKDGFLHTGDIGRVNSRGCYYIHDRKKELIKYKGFQVAPAELEGLLLDHPAVLDAAVIPVFDSAQETELPKAYVVLKPGADQPELDQEIMRWVADRVSHFKALRGGIEFIDAIPKSVSGKILRRVLRSRELAKSHLDSMQAKL